jgi:hypothetical protein
LLAKIPLLRERERECLGELGPRKSIFLKN